VGLAVELLVHPGQDPQQRRLARTVQAQDPDLCPVEIGKADVFQDRLLVVKLGDTDHGINDFIGLNAHRDNSLFGTKNFLGTISGARIAQRGKIFTLKNRGRELRNFLLLIQDFSNG
jgi:hypothetical protein